MKVRVLQFVFMFVGATCFGQVEKSSALYKQIIERDSLLFTVGFNTCDLKQFEDLLSDDFEFYHDQAGISGSKADFIADVKNNLCTLPYRPKRILDANSTEIFPLEKNGVMYGVIQTGVHHFYALEKGLPAYLTADAKFSHVWLLENKVWKLKRVLSYAHKDFEKPINDSLLFKDNTETERWLKQKHIPNLGIGFIEDGKIKELHVYGDLKKNTPAPLNTLWNVASLTKPITAMVALKLINTGKWNLDEPLSTYFVDDDIKLDPRTKLLTTRLVLSHRTGFPNWRGNSIDKKLSFEFDPGTRYQYSGEGFEYLRKALEAKFHKSLQQLASELIFVPLKMKHTSFVWSNTIDSTLYAKGYTAKGESYGIERYTTCNAADNLLTTVEDYCKFMQHVLNGAGISKNLYSEMMAEQSRINAYKHFGLGWWVDERITTNNEFALVHGGDDLGVHTIAFLLPSSKKGLLIFTNCDNGTDVFADILLKYLGKEGEGILSVEMK